MLRRRLFFLAQYSDETLAVFKSFKLDDMQASKRKLEELRTSAGEHVYFAKFLTSEKVGLVDWDFKWPYNISKKV